MLPLGQLNFGYIYIRELKIDFSKILFLYTTCEFFMYPHDIGNSPNIENYSCSLLKKVFSNTERYAFILFLNGIYKF